MDWDLFVKIVGAITIAIYLYFGVDDLIWFIYSTIKTFLMPRDEDAVLDFNKLRACPPKLLAVSIAAWHESYAIYPIQLNPVVREIADEVLGETERVRIIEPLDVFDFHNFMSRSYLILTDSGGIQEEAPALGKPVLVMRDTTERPEGVEAGTLRLVGTNEEVIYKNFTELLSDSNSYEKMAKAVNPYGDGHSAERIADILLQM